MSIIGKIKVFSLVLALWFAVTPASAQKDTLNRIDSKGQKQGYWKKYEGGKLVYEGRFQNDKPVGEFKYYYPSGKLKNTSLFLSGTAKVKNTTFHENGKKSSEGVYVDQKKDGVWNYYGYDEILISTESYAHNRKNGVWKTYSAGTGVLLEEDYYIDDLLHGNCKKYYTDGSVSTIAQYINGELNGSFESYAPGNVLIAKGKYLHNLKTGTWDYFSNEGKMTQSIEYNNSDPVKIYLYLYRGNSPQKIDQDRIAYFQKTGSGVNVVLKDKKSFTITDSFETLSEFLDFAYFCPVSPSFIVSYNAIQGFKEVGRDRIKVSISPQPNVEVYAEGDHAKLVKMIFDKSRPEE